MQVGSECSSYDARNTSCRDGFIQKPYCRGQAGCFACGDIKDSEIPYCLRDEVPAHMVRDDGSPLFYALRTKEPSRG